MILVDMRLEFRLFLWIVRGLQALEIHTAPGTP